MRFHKKLYQELVRNDRLPAPLRGSLKLTSHWIFQGTQRMDSSERMFKIASTAIFTAIFYQIRRKLLSSLILGHSLNFVLNSHLVSALRTFNISFYTEKERFDAYATKLLDKLSSREWVEDVYVTGSVNKNRNEWQPGSDLDVIVIRKGGPVNGIKTVFSALVVRFSATLDLFPLDIYFFDNERALDKRLINEEEDLIPWGENDEE